MVDYLVEIYFYKTEEGGRKYPTPNGAFRPVLSFEKHYYHCQINFNEIGTVFPGERACVPISVMGVNLPMGSKFELWEGKIIATGRVIKIVR